MDILQIVNIVLLYSNNEKNRRLHRLPKFTSWEKAKINSWKRHALRDLILSYERNEIWSIYNDNYFEIWTFYT